MYLAMEFFSMEYSTLSDYCSMDHIFRNARNAVTGSNGVYKMLQLVDLRMPFHLEKGNNEEEEIKDGKPKYYFFDKVAEKAKMNEI